MYTNNEKKAGESGSVMALTVASMNFLILTILIVGIWLVYSLLDKADRLNDLWKVWTV